MNTILNQSYHRRVSIDPLNREDSQLAASLEGEPGPTLAGKNLPHSHPQNQVSEGEDGRISFGDNNYLLRMYEWSCEEHTNTHTHVQQAVH